MTNWQECHKHTSCERLKRWEGGRLCRAWYPELQYVFGKGKPLLVVEAEKQRGGTVSEQLFQTTAGGLPEAPGTVLVGEDQTRTGAGDWGWEQEDGEKRYLGTGMGARPASPAYQGGDKSCPSGLPPWSLLQFLPPVFS